MYIFVIFQKPLYPPPLDSRMLVGKGLKNFLYRAKDSKTSMHQFFSTARDLK